jgi:ribose 5-phosphate isomerase RpiB
MTATKLQKVVIGSDHGGWDMKEMLKKHLQEK